MSLLWTYGLILVRWLYVHVLSIKPFTTITSVRQLKFDLSSLKRLYLVCTFFHTRNKSTGFWTSFQIVNEIKLNDYCTSLQLDLISLWGNYVISWWFKCFVNLFVSIVSVVYRLSPVVKVSGYWTAVYELESGWGFFAYSLK